MTRNMLTLKETCELFDLTPRTLRYYDNLELLVPIKQGRTRFYGTKEQARLKLILRGRRFGFCLEEIRQWLELYNLTPTNRTQISNLTKLTTIQLNKLKEDYVELGETIQALKELQAWSIENTPK